MDKFFRKTKGAISIFLVIVLLPMMTVASVFVDMSRINLAKSMAESAGDLTLNTALTNYDAEMKNLYGLFATSQNMDDLMASLEDYYRDSIIAAGVDSAAADDYVGQIMDYLKSTTGTDDLMNIQLTGFEVSAPEGGNLGNPAIMKSQIVEFMKYRAPLSLGTGFLDALSTMKDLSKQTELVEDKNKFYEKHQDLLGTLEDAWWQIQLYQYADANGVTGFPTGSYLTDQGSTMASNANKWKDEAIVKDTVKYLYRNSKFKNLLTGAGKLQYEIILEYLCPDCDTACAENKTSCTSCGATLNKDYKYHQWKLTWQGSTSVVTSTYSEDNPASADDVLTCLNNMFSAQANLKKYTTGDYSNAYKLANTSNSASLVERIYAVCIFNEEISKSNHYLKAVKTYLECLVELNGSYQTCSSEDLENTKVTYISDGNYVETTTSGTSLGGFTKNNLKHLSLESNNDDLNMRNFNAVVSNINGHYSAGYDTVEDAKDDVPDCIDAIRDQAYKYDKKLETKIGNLTEAIRLLNTVKSSLTDTDSEYYKALNSWKTSANKLSDNTMGKNDLAEIEDVTSILTPERIGALVTRLTNAKTTLEGIREQISKFKFAGTSWKDIKDDITVSDFIGMLSSWDAQIKGIVPQSEDAYDDIIRTILGTVETGSITDTWGESENSPDLTDQQRELYTWLYNNFYKAVSDYSTATDSNATTSADSDMSSMEKSLEKKATDQNCQSDQNAGTNVDRDISQYLNPELKALPSTRWNETQDAIAAGKIETNADNMLKESNKDDDNMLETILSIASNMGAELRDNLYVTEYIMSMFSYDTIEAEKYVEESGESLPASGIAFYNSPGEDSTEYTVKEDYAKYAAMIETMTNNSINPNMNYLYGEEVEYILYGENGAAGVYGTIFVLRFALNTVYAFTDAEINNVTLSAATALFGTPPLTPMIPFAKAAMTIGLAIAESAWDLVELRKGEAVPLMKNSQTWVMSPSGLASEVKDAVKDEVEAVADKAIDAGYKVLNDAIAMTSEELQALISDSEDGLRDLADAALSTVTDRFMNYANEALQEVVELCNLANQKAQFSTEYSGLGATDEKVQQVLSGLDTWLQQQSTDDPAIYEVKKAAVDYLKSNGGTEITSIFNTLQSQASPTATATDLLEQKLKEIRIAIEDKVDTLINSAGSALSDMARNLTDKLETAAVEGAESLKQALSTEIDKAFGAIPENGKASTVTSSTVSSLLSWRYSDYLRVFVVVGLFANEELVLLRIADMIELNMQKKNNEYAVITTTETVTTSRFFGLWKKTEEKEVASVNNAAFSLSKSYTYLTIRATLQVKPLMMTLPFMADATENQLTGTKWYEIEYTGTLGY